MKQRYFLRSLFLFFLLVLSYSSTKATHIVGGEITYEYLGFNNYAITMTIYRDCYNGVPPFDNPAAIGIFDQNYDLVSSFDVAVSADSIPIPDTVNNVCASPGNVCYVQAKYRFTVNLPNASSVYYIAYQRCCRNQTILNINDPDGTGASYIAEIRPNALLVNNSVTFTKLPPLYICANQPFFMDSIADDVDGDSLRYSLCEPLVGADTINPAPVPPSAPPYQPVTYVAPYSVANMLNGISGGQPFSIDPLAGTLTATPTTIGQFVIGICIKEYRNGAYLGQTRRDYQLNVLPCPQIVVAAFLNPITTCGSNTVTFQNGSFGAVSYFWDFGVQGTQGDTSILENPVFTYPDTGTYTVTLTATSPFNDQCKDIITGTVKVRPQLQADFSFTKDDCSNLFQFNDTIIPGTGNPGSVSWKFGDNTISSINDPSHNYSAPGNYVVTLIATTNDGCRDTVVRQAQAVPLLSSSSSVINNVRCNGECNGSGFIRITNANGPFNINWTNPAGQTNDTISNLCVGNYSAIVTDSIGCTTNVTLNITEPPILANSLTPTVAYCSGSCIGTITNNTSGGTTPYSYVWSNGQSTSVIEQLCVGTYTVSVTDANGCTLLPDSATVIYSDSVPPLSVVPDSATIYQGQTVAITSTVNSGYTYSWVPATFLSSSSVPDPVSKPEETIEYFLTIADKYDCRNTDSVLINVIQYECNWPEIYMPNAFSPNNDNTNDLIVVRGGQVRELLLRIYDRWGEKVFETNKPGEGWDGNYKGKKVMPGVFVYYLDAVCYNEEKFFKKGNITVLK